MTEPGQPNQATLDIIQDWTNRHGVLKGPAAPNPAKEKDAQGNLLPDYDPYYHYEFQDGSTLDMNGTGQIEKSNETPKQLKDPNPYPGGVHTNGKGQLVGVKADGFEVVIDSSENASTNANQNPYPGGVHLDATGAIIGIGADGKPTTVVAGDPKNTNPYPGGVHVSGDGRILGIKSDGTTVVIDTNGRVAPNPFPGGVHAAADGSTFGVKPDGSKQQLSDPGKTTRTNVTLAGADGTPHIFSIDQTASDPNASKIDLGPVGSAADLVVLGGPQSRQLSVLNKATGQVTNTIDNPAYQEQAPQELTPNTVAPFIHTLVTGPDGKQTIQSVPNDNQLTVSQAMMEVLVPQLGQAMTDGKMDAGTAKDLVTAYQNKIKDQMTAASGATTAASDTLTHLQQGAQTGAGLLQNRVSETQGQLKSWMSDISQAKNLGLGTPLPGDFGGNLVNGIADWATQMGGGQGVYDNAAKAVAAINPDDPHSAPSYATLNAMQQRFKELAGVDHHTVAPSNTTPLTVNQPQPQPQPVAAAPAFVPPAYQGAPSPNETGLGYGNQFITPGVVYQPPAPFEQSDIHEGTRR